jgi:hypothetical protein
MPFAAAHESLHGTKRRRPIRQACPLLAKAAVTQRILVSELGSKRWNEPQGSELVQCRMECTLPIRQLMTELGPGRNGWGHFLMPLVAARFQGIGWGWQCRLSNHRWTGAVDGSVCGSPDTTP